MNLEEGMVDEDWDKCFLYNVSKIDGLNPDLFLRQ